MAQGLPGSDQPHPPPRCREGTEVLLADLAFPPEELAFGHTKIFIRSPRTVSPGMGEPGRPCCGAVGLLGGCRT